MDQLNLLLNIMSISLKTAALIIPSISVAYFLMSNIEEEKERMSKVISYGSISSIILVVCSLFTFGVVYFEGENNTFLFQISCSIFVLGCLILLYILFILAGFRREIPKV